MDISRLWLRQKYVKRSRISSSRPTASAWTDVAKVSPPTPSHTTGKADDSSQMDYDLPISSRKALPDEYERDDNDDVTKDKVAPRTIHPRLLLPSVRNMIVPRRIETNPSLPERRFPTTINATTTTTTPTTTTTTTKKSREGGSWSQRLDNQTHIIITQNRVGSGELTAMVTVTKKHLHFLIKWGSVYKGLFFVK